LWDLLPLLKNEIIGEGNFGTDYVEVNTTYALVTG